MSSYVPADLRRAIREHFAECCAYCHTAERLTVVTFEVDHIEPTSTGGGTIFSNLCLACPMCNRHKANRTYVVDPNSGQTIDLYHPHRNQWGEHFSWQDQGHLIHSLTPVGDATISALRMNRPQLVRVRGLWIALGEHPPKIDH